MIAERPGVSPPDITIVRGAPTDEELAALVAVLQTRETEPAASAPAGSASSALSGGTALPGGTALSAWAAPASLHRRPLTPSSPDAWRQTFR